MELTNLVTNSREEPDINRLVKIVASDPVLSANILRRINSVKYSLRGQVTSVQKAVQYLGFRDVSNLALSMAMTRLGDVLDKDGEHLFAQISALSQATGFFAHELAYHLELGDRHMAFTVGLLHGFGRYVILYRDALRYKALWATCEGAPSREKERSIFGADYLSISLQAAHHWQLSGEILETLEATLDVSRASSRQSYLVASAVKVAAAAAEKLLVLEGPAELRAQLEEPGELLTLAFEVGVGMNELLDWLAELAAKAYDFAGLTPNA